jgi:hypothetical protein
MVHQESQLIIPPTITSFLKMKYNKNKEKTVITSGKNIQNNKKQYT